MKSLKEQREKLFQEKLAEMADIGVKKRTEENTPDFDVPIDLMMIQTLWKKIKVFLFKGIMDKKIKYQKTYRLMTAPPILLGPRSERETPERRILPQQWTFLNTNSDF